MHGHYRLAHQGTTPPASGGGSGGGGGDKRPPFIEGLLAKLPNPDADWPVDARAKWLTTAPNIFDLMYVDTTGETMKTISISVEAPKGGSA